MPFCLFRISFYYLWDSKRRAVNVNFFVDMKRIYILRPYQITRIYTGKQCHVLR